MSLDLQVHDHGDPSGSAWAPADGQPVALFPGTAPPHRFTRVEAGGEAGVSKKKTTTKKAPVKKTSIKQQVTTRAPVKKAAVPKQAAARKTAVSRKQAAPAKKAVGTKKAASKKQRVRKGV
jgi:hypothetical protein